MPKPRAPQRIVVGLTGGLGSGKSTVLEMLKRKGAACADADEIVHRALSPLGLAYQKVLRLFGPSVHRPDRTLDRGKIAEIVFRSPARRRALEKILHPLVEKEIRKKISSHKKGVLVLDIPLLYEAGMARLTDKVVAVWAPQQTRVRRLVRERGFSKKDAQARLKAQWPLREKCRRADWVIDNGGTLNHTRRQAMELWRRLVEF